jgi:hypothetical protein
MEQKLATTRVIAGALAVLLAIAIVIIINDHKAIADLRSSGRQNITAQRDIIRQDCAATDPSSVERCAQDLKNLSDLLAQFSRHPQANTPLPTH